MNKPTEQKESQPAANQFDYLKQWAVKSKAVKDMSIKEARSEVLLVDGNKDKTLPIKTLSLRLARRILDLNAIVPNTDRLKVPKEHVKKVEEDLFAAVKGGLLDEAIGKILEDLKQEAIEQQNSQPVSPTVSQPNSQPTSQTQKTDTGRRVAMKPLNSNGLDDFVNAPLNIAKEKKEVSLEDQLANNPEFASNGML